MAKKKINEEPATETPFAAELEGTVEGLALEHFERERRAYEQRTGERVRFTPGVPVTRTPLNNLKPTADAEGESTDE